MSQSDSMFKYHVMNTLEKSVNSDGKFLAVMALAAGISGSIFIPDAVNDYNTAMDNQGIEAVETQTYDQISQQIVDFQTAAQELPVMEEKLDYYDDLSKSERTPDIIDEEAALNTAFIELKRNLSNQVKEISIATFNSGNPTDGVAVGEESLAGLWEQLDHTEPSLLDLKQDYDIEPFPDPSFAFLDEARADVTLNDKAPLNVQFNTAKEIASASNGSAVGNALLTALFMALSIGGAAFGAAGINANRRKKFGYYKSRPKPEKPKAH